MIKATNVTINVKDMEVSITFYQKLGFNLIHRWDDYYAQLCAAGITIGLHPTKEENETHSGTVSIGFMTDDFEATQEILSQANIHFMYRLESGGQFLHFTDPDGTALYFIKPKE